MSQRRVLLIVGGGVAAYKALELARQLRKADVAVRPILTAAGAEFVTPLSLAALCEDKVYQDLFSLTDEAQMGHIELSRSADLVVVAPATADLMAKAASGLAGDLASTTLLATDKPVLMAPAMNVRMWLHPATQRNLARLKADGVSFVGPDEGAMACGEFGPGRMAEPQAIFEATMAMLGEHAGGPLAGKHVLITAGPTAEPIDPVRVITNRSSGKQGYAIAGALAALGARVTLVSGPVAISAPPGVTRVDVETAQEMLAACRAALPADAAVCVAAVADWRADEVFTVKMKKSHEGPPTIRLVENPDILAALSARGAARPKLVVGFAAETGDLEAQARSKLKRKGCDWIVANDVSADGIMGGDENEVLLVYPKGTDHWPRASKTEIARRLAERIAADLVGEKA
ncbi:MAG TPA: bifunctional phosphopantothenoylcysteine decarboxylase/phosphopantothenate--cysteine ligase CoaBC [Caulobacteraceae bacterium]|nr:bifunctional phosphopantothenoylcysteine decarboxylase/phosphopantothenate--cysteine ligase CoaBC [Caulobacteraceae bacterium]